eukprot:scaffold3114_cov114-Isochrysis_galbana.AAC.7
MHPRTKPPPTPPATQPPVTSHQPRPATASFPVCNCGCALAAREPPAWACHATPTSNTMATRRKDARPATAAQSASETAARTDGAREPAAPAATPEPELCFARRGRLARTLRVAASPKCAP